jgi:hypothetical protein
LLSSGTCIRPWEPSTSIHDATGRGNKHVLATLVGRATARSHPRPEPIRKSPESASPGRRCWPPPPSCTYRVVGRLRVRAGRDRSPSCRPPRPPPPSRRSLLAVGRLRVRLQDGDANGELEIELASWNVNDWGSNCFCLFSIRDLFVRIKDLFVVHMLKSKSNW